MTVILTSSTIDKKLENLVIFEFIFEFKITIHFEFNLEIFVNFEFNFVISVNLNINFEIFVNVEFIFQCFLSISSFLSVADEVTMLFEIPYPIFDNGYSQAIFWAILCRVTEACSLQNTEGFLSNP